MQQQPDETIIQLLHSDLQRENDQALKMIYESFFPSISNFIRNNSGTEQDTEDIFQDAIIVLFNQVKKGNLNLTCKLKTYFYSICRNLWLNKIRTKRITIDITEQDAFVAIDEGPFQTLIVNDEKAAIMLLLKKMGGNCQKLLTYFYYERIKMEEIAHRLGFANDQVARNKKRKCLTQLTKLVDDSPFFKDFFQ